MTRIRAVVVAGVAGLVTTLLADGAGAAPSSTSEVDFGDCIELATGSAVALSELEERVPAEVPVLSLEDQGVVFPGSDKLGVVITRVLECDAITVTRDGRTRTQSERHVAHVGTPVDTSVLPSAPFSYDGVNSADFSNYILGYYSDSPFFIDAMRRAGVQPIAPASIDMVDLTVDECLVDRTVTVRPRTGPGTDYGFTANGVVPDASCEPSVAAFIGNWWSVEDGQASVLSNRIAGQSAIFLDPAETDIALVAGRNSQLVDVFGAESTTASAFGFSGFIPAHPESTEIITEAGPVAAAD